MKEYPKIDTLFERDEAFKVTEVLRRPVLADIAKCDAKDIDRAVATAREAFESGVWSKAAPAQRKAVLLRLAQLIDDNAEELALLEALEAGKPISECLGLDIPESAACIRPGGPPNRSRARSWSSRLLRSAW